MCIERPHTQLPDYSLLPPKQEANILCQLALSIHVQATKMHIKHSVLLLCTDTLISGHDGKHDCSSYQCKCIDAHDPCTWARLVRR